MTRPDGPRGPVVADIRGRDLRTDPTGGSEVVDRLALTVVIDRSGAIVGGDVDALVGAAMRRGYGRHLAEALGEELDRRSLRASALEDLSGAFLVSGYAPLRAGVHGDPDTVRMIAVAQVDVCRGWAVGTPLLETMRRDGVSLVPMGPPAPAIDDGWHELAAMAPGTVRRRRRLDVAADGDQVVASSHFRDSHAGEDGETVMHEYVVEARVDAERRLAAVEVDDRVLPWQECPDAVGSAQRLVGVRLDELTARVRADLAGPTTCTHLTSTLRSLADVPALAAVVR